MEHLAITTGNKKAQVLADTLDEATDKFLEMGKSPSRKVHEIDNRGSHFYLALYWAQALARQTNDTELQTSFTSVASTLSDNEKTIIKELNDAQGKAVDIHGYYFPDDNLVAMAMRPSNTFNAIIDGI